MVYSPPDCSSINFNISGLYTPVRCDLLNFDFGGNAPYEILSESAVVNLLFGESLLLTDPMVLTDSTELLLEFGMSNLDILIPLAIESSEIKIEYPTIHNVQILPDIVNESVEIDLFAGEQLTRSTEAHHLPIKKGGSRMYGWGDPNKVDAVKTMPFGEGEDIIKQVTVPVTEKAKPDLTLNVSWKVLDWNDGHVSTPSNDFSDRLDDSTNSGYVNWMKYYDWHVAKTFGGTHIFADEVQHIPYLEPGSKDVLKRTMWDEPEDVRRKFCSSYLEPGSNDVLKTIPWGPYSYYTMCFNMDTYYPPKAGDSIQFGFPPKYNLQAGVCSELTFQLNNYTTADPRCDYDHWHSGIRDKYQGIQVGGRIYYPTKKKVYYMLNQVMVKEVLSHKPIEVLSVSATTDRDSWLWQFQMTVASRDCLEAIMPVDGVYATVEITINGYKWLCTVESWSENRQFAGDSWTVTGRSPSIIFGNPIAQKKSNTVTSGWQGQQLFENILNNRGDISNWPSELSNWTADWSQYTISNASDDFAKYTATVQTGFNPLTDWFVPQETLSYTDKTDIEVLQGITGAIGAYIYTEPDATIFNVRPMFAQQPWNWNEENDQIKWKPVIEDMCEAIGKTSQLYPYYDRVHVTGSSVAANLDQNGTEADPANQAVFVNVFKTGYPNGELAPMVTDPLITTSKAAIESGRMVIGKVGEWYEHTLRMNTLCPPPSPMGLFIPGDMISVLERGKPWYGQVTGITVQAATSGKGMVVNQVVSAEQYVWS